MRQRSQGGTGEDRLIGSAHWLQGVCVCVNNQGFQENQVV